MEFLTGLRDQNFVNRVIFPCGGTFYPPADKLGLYHLFWLRNSSDQCFPNIWIPRTSNGVILYSHGNGGTLRDWYAMLKYYSDKFDVAVLGVEYPGYGPASGTPNEKTVNDNVYTAYDYLISIGYPNQNILIMGYSIGTGPSIQLAADLCKQKTPPGGLITIAAFTSIRDIVQDLKVSRVVNVIAPIILMERWNSVENVSMVTCPAIFVHGEQDALIPCSHSVKLHSSCKAPTKRLHFCPKADHVKFREPFDTVDPISEFLKDNFRPQRGVRIEINIPDVRCPREVILKHEAAVAAKKIEEQEKLKAAAIAQAAKRDKRNIEEKEESSSEDESDSSSVSSSDVARQGCWDVSPMVTWLIETASASAALLSPTSKTNLSEEMINTVKSQGNGVPTINSSESSKSRSNTVQAQTNKPRDPPSKLSHSSKKHTRSSRNDDVTLDSMVPPTHNFGPGPDIVAEYFTAFNRHDIDGVLTTLDSKVLAYYPDESKNWSSTEYAPLFYNRIFSQDPELRVNYVIANCISDTYVTKVIVKCQYLGSTVEENKRYRRIEFAVQGQRIIFMTYKIN